MLYHSILALLETATNPVFGSKTNCAISENIRSSHRKELQVPPAKLGQWCGHGASAMGVSIDKLIILTNRRMHLTGKTKVWRVFGERLENARRSRKPRNESECELLQPFSSLPSIHKFFRLQPQTSIFLPESLIKKIASSIKNEV